MQLTDAHIAAMNKMAFAMAMPPGARSAARTFGQTAGQSAIREGFGLMRDMLRERHAQALAAKNAPAVMTPMKGLLMNAGAMLGVTGGMMAGGAAVDAVQIHQSYNKMLQLYPELAREDPQRVKNVFDAVASGSPDLAKQPMIIGSLVRRMLNYDGFDHTTFNDLVSAQSSINKGRSDTLKTLTSIGTSGVGLMHDYGVNVPPRR